MNNSYTDYLIGTHWRSHHFILYETDHNDFGGHQRLNEGYGKWIYVDEQGWCNRRHSLKLYIPSRCAIVLSPFEFAVKYPEIRQKMPQYDPEDPLFKQYIPAGLNTEKSDEKTEKKASQEVATKDQE